MSLSVQSNSYQTNLNTTRPVLSVKDRFVAVARTIASKVTALFAAIGQSFVNGARAIVNGAMYVGNRLSNCMAKKTVTFAPKNQEISDNMSEASDRDIAEETNLNSNNSSNNLSHLINNNV